MVTGFENVFELISSPADPGSGLIPSIMTRPVVGIDEVLIFNHDIGDGHAIAPNDSRKLRVSLLLPHQNTDSTSAVRAASAAAASICGCFHRIPRHHSNQELLHHQFHQHHHRHSQTIQRRQGRQCQLQIPHSSSQHHQHHRHHQGLNSHRQNWTRMHPKHLRNPMSLDPPRGAVSNGRTWNFHPQMLSLRRRRSL